MSHRFFVVTATDQDVVQHEANMALLEVEVAFSRYSRELLLKNKQPTNLFQFIKNALEANIDATFPLYCVFVATKNKFTNQGTFKQIVAAFPNQLKLKAIQGNPPPQVVAPPQPLNDLQAPLPNPVIKLAPEIIHNPQPVIQPQPQPVYQPVVVEKPQPIYHNPQPPVLVEKVAPEPPQVEMPIQNNLPIDDDDDDLIEGVLEEDDDMIEETIEIPDVIEHNPQDDDDLEGDEVLKYIPEDTDYGNHTDEYLRKMSSLYIACPLLELSFYVKPLLEIPPVFRGPFRSNHFKTVIRVHSQVILPYATLYITPEALEIDVTGTRWVTELSAKILYDRLAEVTYTKDVSEFDLVYRQTQSESPASGHIHFTLPYKDPKHNAGFGALLMDWILSKRIPGLKAAKVG